MPKQKLKRRADGRYQRKVTLSDGRQKIVYGRTEAELKAAVSSLLSEDDAGLQIGDHTLVGEWAKIWLNSYKLSLRAATVRMYRGSYNKHIMPVLGCMELRDVRPVHIRKVMSSISDMSESTQSKVLLTMRQLFETARQNALLLRNPCDGIKITRHAQKVPDTRTVRYAHAHGHRTARPRLLCAVPLCRFA